MARPEFRTSFILRVRRAGAEWRIDLHDLRTGRRQEFLSLEALRRHLERLPSASRLR